MVGQETRAVEAARLAQSSHRDRCRNAGNPRQAPKVGKQRTRYKPTGKCSPGSRTWLDKHAERRAAATDQITPTGRRMSLTAGPVRPAISEASG